MVCNEHTFNLWYDTKDEMVNEGREAFGDMPEEWKSYCIPKANDRE